MATYNIDNVPSTLAPGDIINCPYSGSEKSVLLPKGKYKFECWGGKGGYGYDTITMYGGNGGYSLGEYILVTPLTLYLNCGGHGQDVRWDTTSFTKAYNGGGKGAVIGPVVGVYGACGGGGGATHIALNTGALSSLDSNRQSVIMVAGGGGGGYDRGNLAYRDGGKGGGTSGGYGSGNESTTAATQTTAGEHAGFGYGADVDGSTYRGGAGGGGWYGGAAGYGNDAGGNGGSGYINPLLSNAQTTIEATSSNPDSSQNGYIRITVLDAFVANMMRKYSDNQYHYSSHCYFKKNGVWREIKSVYAKKSGVWKGTI